MSRLVILTLLAAGRALAQEECPDTFPWGLGPEGDVDWVVRAHREPGDGGPRTCRVLGSLFSAGESALEPGEIQVSGWPDSADGERIVLLSRSEGDAGEYRVVHVLDPNPSTAEWIEKLVAARGESGWSRIGALDRLLVEYLAADWSQPLPPIPWAEEARRIRALFESDRLPAYSYSWPETPSIFPYPRKDFEFPTEAFLDPRLADWMNPSWAGFEPGRVELLSRVAAEGWLEMVPRDRARDAKGNPRPEFPTRYEDVRAAYERGLFALLDGLRFDPWHADEDYRRGTAPWIPKSMGPAFAKKHVDEIARAVARRDTKRILVLQQFPGFDVGYLPAGWLMPFRLPRPAETASAAERALFWAIQLEALGAPRQPYDRMVLVPTRLAFLEPDPCDADDLWDPDSTKDPVREPEEFVPWARGVVALESARYLAESFEPENAVFVTRDQRQKIAEALAAGARGTRSVRLVRGIAGALPASESWAAWLLVDLARGRIWAEPSAEPRRAAGRRLESIRGSELAREGSELAAAIEEALSELESLGLSGE